MPDVTERWRNERLAARVYDAGVEHERVARVAGFAMWGTDTRRLFAHIGELGRLPAGSAVLDVPCGGGIAFRGLRPGQEVRYVAADISAYMLERARAQAARRGVEELIEFTEADITALPFEDASFDVCLSYNSLHCLPDPRAALAELVRVLRPGGSLRGTTCVTGEGFRSDRFIGLYRRAGLFGEVPTAADMKRWFAELCLQGVALERSGAIVAFETCTAQVD